MGTREGNEKHERASDLGSRALPGVRAVSVTGAGFPGLCTAEGWGRSRTRLPRGGGAESIREVHSAAQRKPHFAEWAGTGTGTVTGPGAPRGQPQTRAWEDRRGPDMAGGLRPAGPLVRTVGPRD